MRALARAATGSLVTLCVALALAVVAVAVLGILATRSATGLGNTIASDQLTTPIVTGQLARNIDAAYAAGQAAVLATQPAQRSRLLGSLYTSLLPAIYAELFSLQQLHADDPPDEQASFELFLRQWTGVRALLSSVGLKAQPATTPAVQLTAAYQSVSGHLDRLLLKELSDGQAHQKVTSASTARATGLLIGAAVLGLVIGAAFLLYGIRRIRRNLEPSQDQAEFADTLQIANDEDEAQRLLQRHLERTLAPTTAILLNRNNSADRLEAGTPPPDGPPPAGTPPPAERRPGLPPRPA